MKKLLTAMMMTLMLVAFGATQVEAGNPATIGVTVTVTAGDLSVALNYTTWDAATLNEGASATTGVGGYFIATNDSTNVTEDFAIQAFASANWSPAAAAGTEEFLMEAVGGDLGTLTSIDTEQALENDLAPASAGTVSFDLKVTAPTATDFGGVEQTIPVRVTASAS